MAEFCVDCWNELHGKDYPKTHFIISEYADFCEGCATWKPVVIRERKFGWFLKDLL